MRGYLQDMKKASSEGFALMHDSPNRRCFTATGVIHEFNKADIMSPISRSFPFRRCRLHGRIRRFEIVVKCALRKFYNFRSTDALTLFANEGRMSEEDFLKFRRSALIQTLRVCALWCKHLRRLYGHYRNESHEIGIQIIQKG
jgi:hypothetical protein